MGGHPRALVLFGQHVIKPGAQVGQYRRGVNMGVWGAFDIAARDSTTTVCLTTLEDVTSTAPDLVDKAVQAYERILGAAMPRAESLEITRTAEGQWKAQL